MSPKQTRPDSFFFSLRNYFDGKHASVRPGFETSRDAVGFEMTIPFGDGQRRVELALEVRTIVMLGRLFDGVLPEAHAHAFWHLARREGRPCKDCSPELRAKFDPFDPKHKVAEPLDEPEEPIVPAKPARAVAKRRKRR